MENENSNANEKNLASYFWECITIKYCCFKGRANRSEFWGFTLFFVFLVIVSKTLQLNINLLNIFFFALLLPFLGVLVRRLHDINRSGWFVGIIFIGIFLMSFIAASGAIYSYSSGMPNQAKTLIFIIAFPLMILELFIFVCTIMKGDETANKYGEVPQIARKSLNDK